MENNFDVTDSVQVEGKSKLCNYNNNIKKNLQCNLLETEQNLSRVLNNLSISMDSLNNSSSNTSSTSDVTYSQSNHQQTASLVLETSENNSNSSNHQLASPETLSKLAELASLKLEQSNHRHEVGEAYDSFDTDKVIERSNNPTVSTTTIKRTHLINLIFELYDLSSVSNSGGENDSQTSLEDVSSPTSEEANASSSDRVLIESFVEKLPPGKTLKNSILLAWKRRYFKLSSIGNLAVYDIDERSGLPRAGSQPVEEYNLMGGRVDYDLQAKVISLDDARGNCLVFRCFCPSSGHNSEDLAEMFSMWQNAIDSQIVDRSDMLWVRPNQLISPSNFKPSFANRNVLIVDIGTCSIRAGLYQNEPKLPKLFAPTVCARNLNQNGRFKAGFDAFDFLLGSSAPSTIDLRKSMSSWSLNSTTSNPNQLVFPFKSKNAIDKLNFDMGSIEAIIEYVVENLNVDPHTHEIVIVTTHRLTDKTNVQYLNMLLNYDKFNFKSATIINQSLLGLYFYNTNAGIVVNLGEKIDILPICNGVLFQSGVTNLAYGGSCMSEYLNNFISRGHANYVNDIEQYFVRYVKEKSCYAAIDYKEELAKFPNDTTKYTLELHGRSNEFKKVEFPESARFKAVEGLFNPEIWGIDGVGIHKLIQKAIQSTSMDLRKEMARSIYLCGGMSQIPGLRERLEKELKPLFPPTLKIKVNCSEFSYHCAYLGAFRFAQQPEYEKLMIKRDEWLKESVNCLRKWRMM